MKRTFLLTLICLTIISVIHSQNADTVVIELAKSSKMVFTMQDKGDLPQLKQYDFQALMNDMLKKLEAGDTLVAPVANTQAVQNADQTHANAEAKDDKDDEGDDDHDKDSFDPCGSCHHKVYQSFNFDFGINNYLENGSFPDYTGAQYTVRPWGSWYVGINSILHVDMGQRFFTEFGFGVSWYNFKFQEDNTVVTKEESGVTFTPDTRGLDYNKSKLEVTYLNISAIPMYALGDAHHHSRWSHNNHDSFRIGLGPYAGYRIESHSKLAYRVNGDNKVEKNKDNFYLNNIRYGLKFQMGMQDADFFVAYDLNELFATGKGPKLHAITFGVVF